MAAERKMPLGVGMLLTLGSWFVPGLGFVVKRDYWRATAIFVLINGTFLLGLLLHGTVIVPEFNYRSPAFNIVNLLMFVGHMGNAAPSLFCLAHDRWNWQLFRPIETDPWFDLAALYLLVSGCMNYFCVCNFYDRYVARTDREVKPAKKDA